MALQAELAASQEAHDAEVTAITTANSAQLVVQRAENADMAERLSTEVRSSYETKISAAATEKAALIEQHRRQLEACRAEAAAAVSRAEAAKVEVSAIQAKESARSRDMSATEHQKRAAAGRARAEAKQLAAPKESEIASLREAARRKGAAS